MYNKRPLPSDLAPRWTQEVHWGKIILTGRDVSNSRDDQVTEVKDKMTWETICIFKI